MPHISLVIATLGRTDELARLLGSLKKQRYTDFDVLIGDQNAPGVLEPILAVYRDCLRITVKSLPPRGLSAARNRLLSCISGELVAFPDDDCWYDPDTLEAVAVFFEKQPDSDGVVGIWGSSERALLPYKGRPPHPVTRLNAFSRAGTHVQFYRRAVVAAVGGFDERLGPGTGLPYGSGEDTDYLLRTLAAGYSVWRTSLVHVFHAEPGREAERSVPDFKWEAYGRGRMYLLHKHRFPLWFKLLNIIYPLCRVQFGDSPTWRSRWGMFKGRVRGFFADHNISPRGPSGS